MPFTFCVLRFWFSLLWFCGSAVLWFSGSVVQRFCGSAVLWFSGSVVLWFLAYVRHITTTYRGSLWERHADRRGAGGAAARCRGDAGDGRFCASDRAARRAASAR